MLDRFEARSSLLDARETRAAENTGAKRGGSAGAKTGTKRKAPARKVAAPEQPAEPSAPRARKSACDAQLRSGVAAARSPAPAAASRPPSSAAESGKTRPGKTKTGQPHAPEQSLSAVGSLNQAEVGATQPGHFIGKDPAVRSPKAPSPRAPTFGGKARAPDVNAPLDMVAAAQRMNPVKNSPGSQAIQGHVSSSVRRSQGKRDSR